MTAYGIRKNGWKTSQFNEYLGELRQDRWVVYNNLSGAMIEVKRDLYDWMRNNNVKQLPEPRYYKALSHGKFIVAENIDEVEEIKEKRQNAAAAVSVIGLQIVPTLWCNFKCTYCYEQAQDKTKRMSPEVMDAVIAHVNRKVKPTTQFLNTMWFGGEPLAAVECIRYLGKALLQISKKNNIQYSAGMVTNGYLLNERNVEMLLQHKINACQVTIDGPEEIHDRRRMLKNGGKTWQTIVENVKYAVSKGMRVSVRMNLDKTNIDSTEKLLKKLEEQQILKQVRVSFGLVSHFGNACRSIEHTLLTLPEANSILKRKKLKDLLKKPGEEQIKRAVPDFIGCVATGAHSVIVGPGGELYKCSKNIGDEREQCGTIFDMNEAHPNFRKWMDCSNLEVETCKRCPMLPICRGNGCAFHYVVEQENIFNCNQSVHHEKYLNKLISLYEQKH
jgi:uncharacterized protein